LMIGVGKGKELPVPAILEEEISAEGKRASVALSEPVKSGPSSRATTKES